MKNQKRKVKKILIRYDMKGQGIVNYDSKEQYWILRMLGIEGFKDRHNNNLYAKKVFFEKPDGTNDYKIKISGNCLKKNMFDRDIVSQNGATQHMLHLNMALISSPLNVVTGYLQTITGENAFNRTTCLNMLDAIQTCNAKSVMEFFTKSGKKGGGNIESVDDDSEETTIDKKDDPKKSDNSIHKKETIGKISYHGEGEISIKQLEFTSTDDLFGRQAFNPDNFEIYSHFAKLQIPNFDSKLGYYRMVNSCDLTPEYGFVFNNDNKNFLVKFILERILDLKIIKNKAKAVVTNVEIKFVYDPIKDTFDSEDGWFKLNSYRDIDDIYVDFQEFYIQEDEEKSKELRAELERIQKDNVEASKKKAKQVANEKKVKKAANAPKANVEAVQEETNQ